jgi:transposase
MSHKTAATVARTIGIDTGKNTLHLIGLDDQGEIVLREKVARGRIAARLANAPRCLIGIEAGTATHYVARELSALGHDVKQVPPAYSKPFRQGNKNDFRDAHAIAEAVQRPSTRCVPVKTDDQLDLQALPGCDLTWSGNERLRSIRSAAFSWSMALRYVRGFVTSANNFRTSWLNAATCCHLV